MSLGKEYRKLVSQISDASLKRKQRVPSYVVVVSAIVFGSTTALVAVVLLVAYTGLGLR